MPIGVHYNLPDIPPKAFFRYTLDSHSGHDCVEH